jgi:hypothetical protein
VLIANVRHLVLVAVVVGAQPAQREPVLTDVLAMLVLLAAHLAIVRMDKPHVLVVAVD